jgi:acetylornithine deacetylase/succinyl-diaminopimelate desuccinylase-like protein
MTAQNVRNYFQSQKLRALEDLKDLVRIPCVSFPGYKASDLEKAAQHTAKLLEEAGMPDVQILNFKDAPPYVLASYIKDKEAPTLLLYAHYDVQPPLRDELWDSPAFEPTERNGRLYGRGTSDDKAGVIAHIATVRAWLEHAKELPLNIKVFIEGEEEVGSGHMNDFLKENEELLACDTMIILDGANFDEGVPAIASSTKGNLTFSIELFSLENPVHSGLWGGPLPDPNTAMCKVLASLTDEYDRICVEGFNETLIPLTDQEKKEIAKIPYNEELLRKQSGLLDGVNVAGDPEKSIVEKLWRSPTLTVTSIEGGKRKGAGNVVMDSSWARVSIRLAPGQKSDGLVTLFENHVKSQIPWNLKHEIKFKSLANSWKTDISHPYFQAALDSQKETFPNSPYVVGCGGTIPLMPMFEESFGKIPIILLGIEDPYTKAHGENESQCIEDFYRVIETQILFLEKVASLSCKKTNLENASIAD